MPGIDELADDGRTDTSGCAGNKDMHGLKTSLMTRVLQAG